MMRQLTTIVAVLVLGGPLFSTPPRAAPTAESVPLIAHEWGTFTSIAGPDGKAIEWLPQTGPTDLPCFVERTTSNVKGALSGTVRMETPVVYFYAAHEMVVNVAVRFQSGAITEWFPHALVTPAVPPAVTSSQTIVWRNVKIAPGAVEHFPVEPAPSHYYAARRTSAAPLMSEMQLEKFLFYRGVGRFRPSIAASVDALGRVRVDTNRPIGDIILFSNDRGRMTYQVRHTTATDVSIEPEVAGEPPTWELERRLVEHGLYPDEAGAMLDTWSDSWFEEGTRVIYIVPRSEIDTILPMQIMPAPAELTRVFVGRMEVVTSATEQSVRDALLVEDIATLRSYGRFLQVIGRGMLAASAPADRPLLNRRLQNAYALWGTSRDRCGT